MLWLEMKERKKEKKGSKLIMKTNSFTFLLVYRPEF